MPIIYRSRGYVCSECGQRLPNERDAVELVSADDENVVIGPFCNDACANAHIAPSRRACAPSGACNARRRRLSLPVPAGESASAAGHLTSSGPPRGYKSAQRGANGNTRLIA
jgi:hypothetical protein